MLARRQKERQRDQSGQHGDAESEAGQLHLGQAAQLLRDRPDLTDGPEAADAGFQRALEEVALDEQGDEDDGDEHGVDDDGVRRGPDRRVLEDADADGGDDRAGKVLHLADDGGGQGAQQERVPAR